MAKKRKNNRKVIPLFPNNRNTGRDRRGVEREGLELKGVVIFDAVVLRDYEQVLFYILGQIVEAQNAVFDECLRRLLGHLAENEDVRDVLRTWERHREEIEYQLESYFEVLGKRGEQ